MGSRNKRLTKAVGWALAFHLLAAAALGIFGMMSLEKLPPKVIEITLDGGIGGGGGGGGRETVVVDKNDILKGTTGKTENAEDIETEEMTDENHFLPDTRTKSADSGYRSGTISPSEGFGSGTGSGSGTGTGSGTGSGSGSGTGSGSGSGEGSGSGSGTGSGSGSGEGSSGEGSGEAVTAPTVISSVKPDYPLSAREAEAEGVAYVSLSVDASGNVTDAAIAGSSGNQALDEAAVEAAYQWQFSPALDRYGQASPCHITIPFSFSLHN